MKRAALTALLLATAPAAQAFEFTGGQVELSYSGYTDNLLKKLDKTAITGSVEVGFSQAFSMQADLGFMNFGFNDDDGTNFGLHSIYHLSDTTSAGFYFGQDRIGGGSLGITGVEIGHQAGMVGLESYLTYAKDSADDGLIFGASAGLDLSDMAEIGVSFDRVDVDNSKASRLALTGAYTMANGFAITGELGSMEVKGAGSQPFFGIGGKMTFGAKRGATFGERSLLNLLPGL